jgi:streptogramin lyase
LAEVGRVELADPPHNVAASGSLVFATHPGTGRVTRLDVSTGKTTTVAVGTEPHDVDFSPDGSRVFITDEDGRSLIEMDPNDLDLLEQVPLPGRGHDSVIVDDGIWTTLVGRDELAFTTGSTVELVETGASPHDLLIDTSGMIWFSNWNSSSLMVFDTGTGQTTSAPAGVIEPHHFSLDSDGRVWVSDNGGNSVVAFTPTGPIETVVGATPHHLALLGDVMVVAVSGGGEIVAVADHGVVSRVPVGTGLHGVAVGRTAELALSP